MSKALLNREDIADLGQMGLPFGVEATSTALIIPDTLDDIQLERLGRQVQKIENAGQWWVADFILFLQNAIERGPKEARNAKRALYNRVQNLWPEYSRATLVTWASIAKRVPPEIRSAELSFQHHIYVANLSQEPQAKQIQQHFIKRAEETGATAEQTRLMIADTKRGVLHERQRRPSKAESQGRPSEPEPLSGSHAQFTDSAQRELTRLRGWYESQAKKSPLSSWSALRRGALVEDMRPLIGEIHKIADIWQALNGGNETGDYS